MRMNSITAFCPAIALAERVLTTMPSTTGVEHAGASLGIFPTRPDTCGNWRQPTASCGKQKRGMYIPAASAASITRMSSGTVSAFAVYLDIRHVSRRKPCTCRADVIFEFVAEMLEHPLYRIAAASPSVQMVRPMMLAATESSTSRFFLTPLAVSIRWITRYNQPVPSRQGVH